MKRFNKRTGQRSIIVQDVMRLICNNALPRNLINNKDFIRLLNDLGVERITKTELEHCITEKANAVTKIVNKKLSSSVCNTLCLDEWTNILSNSIVNFTIINDKGESFLIDVVDNSLDRNTTERIAELTHNVITKLETQNVKVTGLITDNCNAMRALKRVLQEKYEYSNYNSLIQVGCCCHILAIIMKRISQLPFVFFALESVISMSKYNY